MFEHQLPQRNLFHIPLKSDDQKSLRKSPKSAQKEKNSGTGKMHTKFPTDGEHEHQNMQVTVLLQLGNHPHPPSIDGNLRPRVIAVLSLPSPLLKLSPSKMQNKIRVPIDTPNQPCLCIYGPWQRQKYCSFASRGSVPLFATPVRLIFTWGTHCHCRPIDMQVHVEPSPYGPTSHALRVLLQT